MNSFEINKILGALLGTCLVLVAVHIVSGAIFEPQMPAKPGYVIEVKSEEPAGGAAAKAPAETPIATLLASASAEKGASVAKQCEACHNFKEGAGAKIGPDLYNVVDRPIAYRPGLQLFGCLEGKGRRQMGFRYAQQVADQAERLCPGNGNDLRRPVQ